MKAIKLLFLCTTIVFLFSDCRRLEGDIGDIIEGCTTVDKEYNWGKQDLLTHILTTSVDDDNNRIFSWSFNEDEICNYDISLEIEISCDMFCSGGVSWSFTYDEWNKEHEILCFGGNCRFELFLGKGSSKWYQYITENRYDSALNDFNFGLVAKFPAGKNLSYDEGWLKSSLDSVKINYVLEKRQY